MVRDDRRAATAVIPFDLFAVMLDVTVVNVALGDVGTDLWVEVGTLQWVVDTYMLVLVALLLATGAACDHIGARRVYLIGLLGFEIPSSVRVIALTGGALVATWAVQGVRAAVVTPGSLTLLSTIHPDPAVRARAIGLWGGARGMATTVEPILDGMLVIAVGWWSVSWINLPVITVVVLLTVGVADGAYGATPRSLDLLGPGLSTLGFAVGTWTVILVGEHGWGTPQLVTAAVGAGLLTGFVAVEHRAPELMLPPGLFIGRGFTVAVTVGFYLGMSFFGQPSVLSLFPQRTLGLDAWDAGLAFAPQVCSAVIVVSFGGRAATRSGTFPAMLTGLVLEAAGFAGIVSTGPGTTSLVASSVAFAVGFGVAFAMPTATAAVVSTAPGELARMAGGIVSTTWQAGGAVGVTVLDGVVTADVSSPGFRVVLLLVAGIFTAVVALAAAAACDPA